MSGVEPTGEPMRFSMNWDDLTADNTDDTTAAPWERALLDLANARKYWLATVRPDGRPHLVPVLAVAVDATMHFCASATSRKLKNLARDPHCVITTSGDGLDLVLEGKATKVDDEARLHRVAEAYVAKYAWHPEVRDGALWADGAPTAGPPPYEVHTIAPATAFGFPAEDEITPTRWRFSGEF
jgi:hypothetical protein